MIKSSIAITKYERDFVRILPYGRNQEEVEIKFSFIEKDSFIIRKYDLNTEKGLLYFTPTDHGMADHEITYHNANKWNPSPVLLPKHKDASLRIPISQQVINLNFRKLIAPIPICRVTVNRRGSTAYKKKKKHFNIDLEEYCSTEIYIAPADYDLQKKYLDYPIMLGSVFLNTTIDYLLYGAGIGAEPIFEKMARSNGPVMAYASTIVGNYMIIYKVYNLKKTDPLLMSYAPEYSRKNMIEFFDNVEYLDLLATTTVSFSISERKTTPLKPAYVYDLDHLRKMGAPKMLIRRLDKRFRLKAQKYRRLKKLRSGLILPYGIYDGGITRYSGL